MPLPLCFCAISSVVLFPDIRVLVCDFARSVCSLLFSGSDCASAAALTDASGGGVIDCIMSDEGVSFAPACLIGLCAADGAACAVSIDAEEADKDDAFVRGFCGVRVFSLF